MTADAPSRMRTVFLALEGLTASDLPHLPALQALVAMGSLSELTPPLPGSRVAALVTAMTGTWADQHQVLLAAVPVAGENTARAVAAADRARPAVWEMLDAHGVPALAVGWPATAGYLPRTAGSATVDARFEVVDPAEAVDWLHAEADRDILLECRMGPDELDLAALDELLPDWRKVEQLRDSRLAVLAGVIAASVSLHAVFLELLERRGWDFATLTLSLPAELARLEIRSAATPEAGIFRGLHRRGLALLDAFLSSILSRLPEGTRLLIAGVEDAERPMSQEMPAARGFVLLHGPGVAAGAKASGANLLDLAPTAWRLMGWHPPAGCAGRPLVELLQDYPMLRSFTAAWRVSPAPVNGGAIPIDAAWLTRWRIVALRIQAACLTARQEWDEAIQLLERRWQLQPDSLALLAELVEAQYFAGRTSSALDDARDLRALADPADPVPLLMVAGLEAICGDLPTGRRLLDSAAPLVKARPAARLFQGRVLIHLRQWQEARGVLEDLLSDDPGNAFAWEQLARAFLGLRAWTDASDAALRATALNLHNAPAHEALGEALYGLGMHDEARAAFKAATDIAPKWKLPRDAMAALAAQRAQ